MPKPFAPNELLTKVNELMTNRAAAQGPAKKTTTVLSLRGGVGVTSIAVNLALACRAKGHTTCLIDLKPGPGHVALQLRMNVKTTWIDWANGGESTPESVVKTMLTHEAEVQVLAAPIVPAASPTPERVATLLNLVQGQFARIVIDAPGIWHPLTLAALSASDTIWVILAPEVGSLQSTVGTLRAMKMAKIPDDRVELIANQVMPRPGLALSAIEKALGHSFKGKLPYDDAQNNAISQGTPLMLSQPDSPLAAAIRELA